MSLSSECLLRIIDAATDRIDPRAIRAELLKTQAPPTLGPKLTNQLNESLRRGIAKILVEDGWRPLLRDQPSKHQRLWEFHPLLAITFSPASQQLLTALVCQSVVDPEESLPEACSLTTGDELLIFLVGRLFHRAGIGEAIALHSCFHLSPLSRLAFPQHLESEELDLAAWNTPDGLCLIEGLQPAITHLLLAAETHKMSSQSDLEMTKIGRSQAVAAASYLELIWTAQRPYLAECYLATIESLIKQHQSGDAWLANLGPATSLPDRARAAAAARATLAIVQTLEHWFTQAQQTNFMDENYISNQRLLSNWEHRLPTIISIANDRLRELDPLTVASTTLETT